MSDFPLLTGLRNELIRLAELVVAANARVEVVGGQLRESSGSAWLYGDCLWITNHHVVGDARGSVTLNNGAQRIDGEVVGKDAETDLAVIRTTDPIAAKPLVLRDAPARLGELCFSIGAPLGEFADSMSMGIVSGLNRRLPQPGGRFIEDVLQTDAAINHGNSGGPLVDIDGCVLGVNTAAIEATAIGFAVPAHTVAEIAPELIETGTITRATIGAQIEIRRSRTAPGDDIAILKTVDRNSPLRPGDLLREFAGRSMKRRADLMRVLRRDIIGREVPIVIERDGKAHVLSITPQRRAN